MKGVDKLAKMRETMTPRELERELGDNSEKGAALFNELLDYGVERNKRLKENPFVAKQISRAKEFYEALIADGLIQIEEMGGNGSILDMYSNQQAMETAKPYLNILESKVPEKRAIGMAQVYRLNYEHICKTFLRPLASRIAKRQIRDNGEAIRIVKEYRSEEFKDLFEFLVPQIRNAVDHHDFYFDGKTKKLEFRDRGKQPLVIDLNDFHRRFMISFTLTLAMSAAEFEIREPFLRDVASKKETVARYIKKHDLRIVRGKGGRSIYEIGQLLEKNREKW